MWRVVWERRLEVLVLVLVFLIWRGGWGLGREFEKKVWDKLGYVVMDFEDMLRLGLEFKVIFVFFR